MLKHIVFAEYEIQEIQQVMEDATEAVDDATKLIQELDAKLQNALRLLARTEQERSIAVRQVKYLQGQLTNRQSEEENDASTE